MKSFNSFREKWSTSLKNMVSRKTSFTIALRSMHLGDAKLKKSKIFDPERSRISPLVWNIQFEET